MRTLINSGLVCQEESTLSYRNKTSRKDCSAEDQGLYSMREGKGITCISKEVNHKVNVDVKVEEELKVRFHGENNWSLPHFNDILTRSFPPFFFSLFLCQMAILAHRLLINAVSCRWQKQTLYQAKYPSFVPVRVGKKLQVTVVTLNDNNNKKNFIQVSNRSSQAWVFY